MTNHRRMQLSLVAVSVVCTVAGHDSLGASGRDQTTTGSPVRAAQRIKAQDGDIIIVENDARVRVIRRRQAAVRAVFNAAERWVILVVDYAHRQGEAPDGRVDATHNFREIAGDWPLGDRWEGGAVIEEYSAAGPGRHGLGIRTAQGLIQFLGAPDSELFKDPSAIVMSYRGAGSGTAGGMEFDEAEKRAVAEVARNMDMNAQRPRDMSSSVTSFGSSGGVTATVTASASLQAVRGGPLRVGGNVRPPQKIHDVPPVLPATADQAGVRGTVILELTVGIDGAVTDARVLRSIPLLDAAALDAARQWRYEPVLLNGQPVSVIFTQPVLFKQ